MTEMRWKYYSQNNVKFHQTLSTVGPIRQVTWDYCIMNNLYDIYMKINYVLPLWYERQIHGKEEIRWFTLVNYRTVPSETAWEVSAEKWASDQWHMGLQGKGTLTPAGHWEYWKKIDVCPNKCVIVGTGILIFPHTLEFTDQQSAPPQYGPSQALWSIHTNFPTKPSPNTLGHTHTHTHPKTPCWTPGDSNRSLKVRVEGQKGSGEGGKITMVPHGYLNMS